MKSSVLRELRAAQRFAIELPVLLTSRSGNSVESHEALTRDISTRGMFVTSSAAAAEGEIIEFEIDLAWDDLTPLVLVKGEGRVVRIERDAQSSRSKGFAVQNVWFKLRPPEEGEAIPAQSSAPMLSDLSHPAAPPKSFRRLSIVPKNRDIKTRKPQ